jgi:Uma2 family endonuclease
MSTLRPPAVADDLDYPTGDGRPMAETDLHRILMVALIQTLGAYFANDPQVYVSGNLLVFYERGNRRRHLAPDVFVVRGVPKRVRDNYLIWQEGHSLDLVIELTSRSTREEDLDDKFGLYRDVLQVRECFLFDPRAEYLTPPLQGFRLEQGQYVAINPVESRLPSEVLGLHLERDGTDLRLWNPATGLWLPTLEERTAQEEAARRQAEEARRQAEETRQQEAAARRQAEAAREQEAAARREEAAGRQQAEAEIERLRRELDELRRRPPAP